MKLAVLGSNKLVTTTNALLSEIFTGLIQDHVTILSEERPEKDYSYMKDLVFLFDVEPAIELRKVGRGIGAWRNEASSLAVDVADVTPGRKYTAIALYVYSKASEVRYFHVEDERSGYRVFGYIPFQQVEVYNLRSGGKIPFDPPEVKGGAELTSLLSLDSLRAFLNSSPS